MSWPNAEQHPGSEGAGSEAHKGAGADRKISRQQRRKAKREAQKPNGGARAIQDAERAELIAAALWVLSHEAEPGADPLVAMNERGLSVVLSLTEEQLADLDKCLDDLRTFLEPFAQEAR